MRTVQIEGKDYYLNLNAAHGSTGSGDVNLVIELYDATEEPTFTNGQASVEPARIFHCFGDAGAFYYALKPAFEMLEVTRSW